MPIGRKYQIKIYFFSILEKLGLKDDKLFFIVTIGVGALCGLISVLFKFAIHALFDNLYSSSFTLNNWWIIVLIPAIGGLIAGILLHYFFPEARGSGIPQLKAALYARSGNISLRTVLGKFLLSVLCIGTGHSVGREGPTVHITGGIASIVARWFYFSREKMQTLVQVGATAGLAAAFNTPLAAVTFTIEEVVGNFNAKILGASVLAAVAACMIERSLVGNSPVFFVPEYSLVSEYELLFYIILGLFAGIISSIFIKGLLSSREAFKNKLPAYTRPLQPFIGGLMIGLIGLIAPQVMGIGYETVNAALLSDLPIKIIAVLIFLKLLATIISYSSGNAGGIFAPSLFIGAMAGGFVGYLVHAAFPTITANYGAYALVGMGAVFAGIIRAPMTSVLIIFEMTHDYSIILPLMISNLISYTISERTQKIPLYDALALQDGIHLPSQEEYEAFKELHVAEIMQIDMVTFLYNWPIIKVAKKNDLKYSRYPVIDSNGDLIGLISSNEIKKEIIKKQYQKKLYKITEIDPNFHTYPDQSVEIVLRKMGQKGIKTIPVVDRENTKNLLGILTASDIFKAYGIKDDKF